jgi:hypothetical protein
LFGIIQEIVAWRQSPNLKWGGRFLRDINISSSKAMLSPLRKAPSPWSWKSQDRPLSRISIDIVQSPLFGDWWERPCWWRSRRWRILWWLDDRRHLDGLGRGTLTGSCRSCIHHIRSDLFGAHERRIRVFIAHDFEERYNSMVWSWWVYIKALTRREAKTLEIEKFINM